MKKTNLEALYKFFKGDETVDISAARQEIFDEYEAEVNLAKARMDIYEKARPVVLSILSDTPLTLKEMYEGKEELYPEGFTRGKLQYMITRLMKDEVQVYKNGKNPNTYARK